MLETGDNTKQQYQQLINISKVDVKDYNYSYCGTDGSQITV